MWLSTLSHSLTSVFIKEIKTILFWKDERYVPCLTVLIQLIVGPVELYKKKKKQICEPRDTGVAMVLWHNKSCITPNFIKKLFTIYGK